MEPDEPVVFSRFELGQLYAALGATQLSKLSPDLRRKLRGEFRRMEDEPQQAAPLPLPPVQLAAEEEDDPVYSANA